MSNITRSPQFSPAPVSENSLVISSLEGKLSRSAWVQSYDIAIASAKGSNVTDFDGKTYLDFLSSASTTALGYGHKELIETLTKTLTTLSNTCSIYTPHRYLCDFVDQVFKIAPGNFEKTILFGLSGSDAIEGAMKAARRYRNSSNFVSFRNSFHGTRLSAQAMTGFPGMPGGMNDSIKFLDFPTTEHATKTVLSELDETFSLNRIAAVLIEPIQGDAGNILPAPGFLSSLEVLCKKNEVLILADEVQTGMGRSGYWWASQALGLTPDILIAGKAVTGGYFPMSYCVGRREVLQALEPAEHAFTYGAHPAACALGSKVIELIEAGEVLTTVQQRGEQLRVGIEAIAQRYQSQMEIRFRGIGLQCGLEVEDEFGSLVPAIVSLSVENGLLLGMLGPANQVIRLHPALNITKSQIENALETLDLAIGTVAKTPRHLRRAYEGTAKATGGLSFKKREIV